MYYISLDEKIESITKDLLKSYFKNKESQISAPIDPIDIIEYLGYSVEYVDGKYDRNIYGALITKTKTVEVNNDVSFNEGMENFTLAHEIGHIILHAGDMDGNKNSVCDIDLENVSSLKEFEADKFASFLLMPTQIVEDVFYRLRKKPIYIKNNLFLSFFFKRRKRKRALEFAGRMIEAGNFTNVSKLAMVNRLIGMGLMKGLPYQKNIQNRRNYHE